MPLTRRHLLQGLGYSTLAAMHTGLAGRSLAADAAHYRAIVCLFLFGGLDCHDLLIPYDPADYAVLAGRRREMFDAYGEAREREALLPLSRSDEPGQAPQWAMPPELAACRSLFEAGDLAIVANVGPLLEPTDRRAFLDRSVVLPSRLFSHNDQQATWQSGSPEGAQYGWGGLFADALATDNPDAMAFATIATAQSGPFLTGLRAFPYQLSTEGAARINLLERVAARNADLHGQLLRHLRGEQQAGPNLMRRDLASSFASSVDTNSRFNAARELAEPLSTAFPASPLGQQLQAVAETIALRDVLGVQRQVFFVGLGGFDTHSAQATTLPGLLSGLDASLSAFHAAMGELGVSDQVTLFSASDFGRTLAVNGDGTDHGWGGHHLVMGGAVAGGRILGVVPPPVADHDQDAGSGRLIPTLAVEQLAAPLGQWFGLSDDALGSALPRLSVFDRTALSLFG